MGEARRARAESKIKITIRRPTPPWTPEEGHRLRALAEAGRTAAGIGEQLNRGEAAVRKRAAMLGVSLRRIAKRKNASSSRG
jgi:hypothetical protein